MNHMIGVSKYQQAVGTINKNKNKNWGAKATPIFFKKKNCKKIKKLRAVRKVYDKIS